MKPDQNINGKQLLINNFGITIFQQKSPRHLRKQVNNMYMQLKELNEISLNTTATQIAGASDGCSLPH